MSFELVVSTPDILSVITAYHGPCLSAVLILTLYVQIFRDNEDRVQELWACGRTASGWEGDRYAEELQEEMDALERDRAPTFFRVLGPIAAFSHSRQRAKLGLRRVLTGSQ